MTAPGLDRRTKKIDTSQIRSGLLNERGMITVEVAVIVPMLTMMITGMVFFVLFLLDMSVVKSESQRIADETAAAWRTEGDLATGDYTLNQLLQRPLTKMVIRQNEALKARAANRLKGRILTRTCLVRNVEVEVCVRGVSVCASCRIGFHMPFRGMSDYFLRDGWTFNCSSRALIDCVQEDLRLTFMLNRRKKNGE